MLSAMMYLQCNDAYKAECSWRSDFFAIFSYMTLRMQKSVLSLVNTEAVRGSTHACILREPEICFFDEI